MGCCVAKGNRNKSDSKNMMDIENIINIVNNKLILE